MLRITAMLDDDAILNSPVVYSEEEVLAEFKECCEAEADQPGRHAERVKRATEDLIRHSHPVEARKK